MSQSEIPTNYVKHTTKNPLQKFFIENFFSALINLIKPLNSSKILDAGCGEGFSLNKLIINKVGKELEGIEYSKDAINIGKKLFPKAKIKQGDIYNLPYKENEFDLVLATEVLEHLDDPQKAVGELVRVSKKYIVISVPNEPIFRMANFMAGKYLSELGNSPGHINHWTPSSLIKMLENNNLRVIEKKFPFPWTIVLAQKI